MTETIATPTSAGELDGVLSAAGRAAGPLVDMPPATRAGLLRGAAEALDAAAGTLVPPAMRESHLTEARLRGELGRTTFQLRLLAEVLDDGGFLDAAIDPPRADWPAGGRPDLRRMLLPIGPVVVFAASNFPFAFSVAGGDTAAALAAGCPVVLKAHPGHPELSRRTGEIVSAALREAGAPDGAFAVIYGDEAGRAAVLDPRIRAGAFTGSLRGGRALFDLACSRAEPIPFYAEMGSVNPAFVTRTAAAGRAAEIADGYLGSFTLGAGQFCTKPGLLLVPAESVADFERPLVAAVAGRAAEPLLGGWILDGYRDGLNTLSAHPAVRVLVDGAVTEQGPRPSLLATTAAQLIEHRERLLEECFGPVSILAGYEDEDELIEAARAFPGQLTATVHGDDTDAIAPRLLAVLRERAGRVVWNGWPTGVAVTHAVQHGGPYPATTAPLHTSVGTAAIARFLRPVAYQNVPQSLLPAALQDGNPLGIPRRLGGTPTPPEPTEPTGPTGQRARGVP